MTYLLFMDDLKQYPETEEKLEEALNEVVTAVGMEIGIRKCAVGQMKVGRTQCSQVASLFFRRRYGLTLGPQPGLTRNLDPTTSVV